MVFNLDFMNSVGRKAVEEYIERLYAVARELDFKANFYGEGEQRADLLARMKALRLQADKMQKKLDNAYCGVIY